MNETDLTETHGTSEEEKLAKESIVFQRTPGALDEINGGKHNSEADTNK